MNITYIKVGDYFIPDIRIHRPSKSIGHYGKLRRAYLKGFRPILYNELVLSEELYPHCDEIDEAAQSSAKVCTGEQHSSAAQYGQASLSQARVTSNLLHTCIICYNIN